MQYLSLLVCRFQLLPNYQIDSKTRLSAYGKQRQCPLGRGDAQRPTSDTKVLALFFFLDFLEQFHQLFMNFDHMLVHLKKNLEKFGFTRVFH